MATLYIREGSTSGTSSAAGAKGALAAAVAGTPVTVKKVKKGDAAPASPLGNLPLLVSAEGDATYGGNAVARRLAASHPWYGPAVRQAVDAWLDFSLTTLEAAFAPWLAALEGDAPYLGKEVKVTKQNLMEVLGALEGALGDGRQFAVGSALTLADVALVCDLAPMFALVLDGNARAKLPNVTSYYTRVAAAEPFVLLFGEPKLCKKEAGAPKPAGAPSGPGTKPAKDGKQQKQPQPQKQKGGDKAGGAKETKLGLNVTRGEDFGLWYSQVVREAEMIEYYDISGCYILRPWAFKVWEQIQSFFDKEIKKLGVENSYFPLFVSEQRLNAEKDHVEGFSPEVAWVTRSGKSELEEPIAVRPTSETVMYPVFAKWIRSHRDLPLKLNQWCNVVRWEFKHPTPFIRSREFLWQEGHTAFASKAEADVEVRQILRLYQAIYEDLMCVPVVPGVKSEKERFPGGLYTTTVEAFVPATGRAIQGATSHCLGQNFAKMFDISFEGQNGLHKRVWQNSWGCTTRTIGVQVMVHGDDKGLVLPPRIAPLQVVIVPIPNSKLTEEQNKGLADATSGLESALRSAGVRVKLDDRDNYTPGWKFNHWELKGVPVRVEMGARDLDAQTVVVVRRDTGAKQTVALSGAVCTVQDVFSQMHVDMLQKAKAERDASIEVITTWAEMTPALNNGKMVLAPWCEDPESEEWAKDKSNEESATGGSVKTLCIPFKQPPLKAGTKCFITGKPATCWCLWGRSY